MHLVACRSRWARLALLVALSAQAGAQSPAALEQRDPHVLMRELIAQIEQSLGRVDEHLARVDAAPARGARSNVADALAAARDSSRRALEQIDRLLELRRHPHSGGGGT